MTRLHLTPRLPLYMLGAILIAAILYLPSAVQAGAGAPLMPVDDAYIHFQYARQIASGEPFVYVSGEPATSGATSLMYPWLLAAGWGVGFRDLSLGWVAVALGVACLAVSAWLVDRLAARFGVAFPAGFGLAFLGCGAFAFHAVSGMETSLVVMLALLTLYAFEREHLTGFIVSALFLALSRPEGSVLAALASGVYALRHIRLRGLRHVPLSLGIPVLAVFVQPVLNWLITGSFSATGAQAKSLLSLIPPDFYEIALRIVENFIRAWREILLGRGDDGLWYLPPLWGVLALLGYLLSARKRFAFVALIALWSLALVAAISTLDTAFWHFKRYHMPLLALTFPGVALLAVMVVRRQMQRGLVYVGVFAAALTGWPFAAYYAQNVNSIAAQPLLMARWLSVNAPGARVAVHDVGLIGYLGGVHTLDMVGLTTTGAADAWRNGPGAVGQFWMNPARQPDLFAAYTEARGLRYLADALYGTPLVEFPTQYDPTTNIALGGTLQGIYRPDWTVTPGINDDPSSGVKAILAQFVNAAQVDQLDVADLISETSHDYRWSNQTVSAGFATELYRQERVDCAACISVDGGRRMNGAEYFVMRAQPGLDHLLVTRVHAVNGGRIQITGNGASLGERTIPVLPGQWLDIPTLIPAALVTSENLTIEVAALFDDGHYMPYIHTLWAGEYQPSALQSPLATFEHGALVVGDLEITQGDGTATIRLNWAANGLPLPDAMLFIHVIDQLDQPPLVQIDRRLLGGSLPPGNLIPGVLPETYVLDLRGIPAGTYSLVLGLFDPNTFERWTPVALSPVVVVDARRLVIGQIEVKDGR